ncbi:MAG: aldo/keto reductase [Actinomycetia bacterium]|nr:aldo/keto reductase [Actinomycetes bacterium]
MSALTEHFRLTDGRSIPKIGFGTWQTPDDVAPEAVRTAIEAGYTHIDTARAYENEAGVGTGLRAAGIAREHVFVTTKVPAQFKSYDEAKAAIDTSLKELDLGYIDLLLIHAPKPWPQMFTDGAPRYFDENLDVWLAMEKAYARGDVRSLGVSNFDVADIQNITSRGDVAPVVNQIRFHVGHTQPAVTAYCQSHGIVVEAYSPLGTGKLLGQPDLVAMAARYDVSVAQLCIRYTLQKDTLPLPKSTHAEFIRANTQVDFLIADADMATLDALTVS